MLAAVRQAGGRRLRQDDSYQPEAEPAEAGPAAAAAAPTSSSGSGLVGLPGVERRELLLRVFPGGDHFWSSGEGSATAQYAVGWLEGLLLPQQQQQQQLPPPPPPQQQGDLPSQQQQQDGEEAPPVAPA